VVWRIALPQMVAMAEAVWAVSRQSVRGQLRKELDHARELLDGDQPLAAARIAQNLIEDLSVYEDEALEVRRAAFRMMEEAFGWSHGDIATEFKGRLTRQRIGQIVNG
jgi:TRAP-type C4-dicarboxylate transport system substrate-binding protein